MKVGLALGLGSLLSLWSGMAAACPQCASRAGGGASQVVMLAVMILLPYAVVAVVLREIRKEIAREAVDEERP